MQPSIRPRSLSSLLALGCLLTCAVSAAAKPKSPVTLLTPKELSARLSSVHLLDARGSDKFEKGHLPDALSLPWVDFSEMPKSPKLRPLADLIELVHSKGIPSNEPLVVYGDGKDGWGEEGRLVWTLLYLGHKNVSLLDGGIPAWKSEGFEVDTVGPPLLSARFAVKPVGSYRIELPELKKQVTAKKAQLLDVRDRDEFEGARKYGEARGGHIPGAVHLPWKELIEKDGRLKGKPELVKLFEARGLQKDKPVVVYCTGGVRSGFAFTALLYAGFSPVNYDGSFWEWALEPALPIEGGKPKG